MNPHPRHGDCHVALCDCVHGRADDRRGEPDVARELAGEIDLDGITNAPVRTLAMRVAMRGYEREGARGGGGDLQTSCAAKSMCPGRKITSS